MAQQKCHARLTCVALLLLNRAHVWFVFVFLGFTL